MKAGRNPDERPDSRWEQMTTPIGHNRRDPGVPSTSEKRRGSGRREGEEESLGAPVGKNQTGPNYRNQNESVSRELSYLQNKQLFAFAQKCRPENSSFPHTQFQSPQM